MSVRVARPDVSDLNVAVFARTVHPELFDFCRQRTIEQPDFRARIGICEAGHVIQWHGGHEALCEVVAPRDLMLPRRHRLCDRKLRGSRDESLWLPGGISYQLSFQVERLEPEIFLHLHEEFCHDCCKATLGHIFAPPNRLAPPAISYLQVDLFPHSLLVHAFHTFPECCAVVKTQSLIELAHVEEQVDR